VAAKVRLASLLTSAWQRRGPLAWLLSPLALLFAAVVSVRRAAYAHGLLRATRITAPVVVIGNLYVGGTGKTPLTIELVRELKRRGFRPGVISRGYGGAARIARIVDAADAATDVGDEPLVIAAATAVPVAIGARRAQAAALLLQNDPSCDVVIADDGLQHLALARDVEIAVIDERKLGNGWVLPAGPLREAPRRLATVDAIVLHGTALASVGGVPCFRLDTRLSGHAYRLADPGQSTSLDELAERQQSMRLSIVAAAGIGVPQRFFDMLTAAGLHIEPLPLPDHFDYRDNPFTGRPADLLLITEKDAVKCRGVDALRNDPRIWVVPLQARLDAELVDLLVARLNLLRKNPNGSPVA
jgi:tetraacyldisaccharide 4'-kinase